MNNKELITTLAKRLNKKESDIKQLLYSFNKSLAMGHAEDTSIAFAHFGTFEIKKKQDRVLINPSTKEKMIIPPKLTISFKLGNAYKEKIKNLTYRGK